MMCFVDPSVKPLPALGTPELLGAPGWALDILSEAGLLGDGESDGLLPSLNPEGGIAREAGPGLWRPKRERGRVSNAWSFSPWDLFGRL